MPLSGTGRGPAGDHNTLLSLLVFLTQLSAFPGAVNCLSLSFAWVFEVVSCFFLKSSASARADLSCSLCISTVVSYLPARRPHFLLLLDLLFGLPCSCPGIASLPDHFPGSRLFLALVNLKVAEARRLKGS